MPAMIKKSIVPVVFLLLASSFLTQAQNRWSGSVTLNGGTNFKGDELDIITDEPIGKMSNINGEAALDLRYKAPKFELKAKLGGSKSYLMTTKEAMGYKITGISDDDDILGDLMYDQTQTEKQKNAFNAGIDAIFTPGPSDRITLGYTHKQFFEDPMTQNLGFIWGSAFTLKLSCEETEQRKYDLKPSFEWLHSFDAGRDFSFKASWAYANDFRYTEWFIGRASSDDESGAERTYRLTPLYIDSDLDAEAAYKSRDLRGIKGLDLDLSVRGRLKRDSDHYSAANLIEDIWVDSTRFRENFDYLALTVEPRLRVNYDPGPYRFELDLIPQYFTDRLNSDSLTERFDKGQLDGTLKAGAWWRPKEGHSLGITFNRSIARPDYLQMCWFRRPGSYINELQQGNPSLKPTTTNKMSVEYSFSRGRFSSKLDLGVTYQKNKIERTFNMVDLEGTETRIFTWINAGKSRTGNATLKLKWSGKKLKAGLNGGLNYFVGESNNGTVTENCDYKVDGDVSYDLPAAFHILGKFRYQSKIIRSYTSITEYIGCDLRISRTFWKKFDVFLEGRDLFDNPIVTETFSADETEGRSETWNYNRRLFVLGVKYSF